MICPIRKATQRYTPESIGKDKGSFFDILNKNMSQTYNLSHVMYLKELDGDLVITKFIEQKG